MNDLKLSIIKQSLKVGSRETFRPVGNFAENDIWCNCQPSRNGFQNLCSGYESEEIYMLENGLHPAVPLQ